MGWIFLWPFFDKLLGLGFSTKASNAWILGVSPTAGFLKFATTGPFKDLFRGLSGNIWIDFLFMGGLLLIGLSLILGVGLWLSAIFGSVLLFLMWLSLLPVKQNPFLDEHIIYIIVLWTLFFYKAGDFLGLGKWWGKVSLVRKYNFLK